MTPTQRRRLCDYLCDCMAILSLDNWFLTLMQAPPDDDCTAMIEPAEQYREAKLYVSDEILDWTKQDVRAIFAHELSHLYTARMDDCGKSLKRVVGKKAYRLWYAAFDTAEESTVESIARVVEQLLPLPPKF